MNCAIFTNNDRQIYVKRRNNLNKMEIYFLSNIIIYISLDGTFINFTLSDSLEIFTEKLINKILVKY